MGEADGRGTGLPKISTRALGAGFASAGSLAGAALVDAAPAKASQAWHRYIKVCAWPKQDRGTGTTAYLLSYLHNHGYGHSGCTLSGVTGTNVIAPCVRVRSNKSKWGSLTCSQGHPGPNPGSAQSTWSATNIWFSTASAWVRGCGQCIAGTFTKPHIID